MSAPLPRQPSVEYCPEKLSIEHLTFSSGKWEPSVILKNILGAGPGQSKDKETDKLDLST